MKKILALIMSLVACALLSGCVGLGDLVFGLSGLLGGGEEPVSSAPPAASSGPALPESQSAPPAEDTSAPADESEPEGPALQLDPDIVGLLGQTNGQLKALNGDACYNYVMYGGSPVADYGERPVAYPYAFWMFVEQEDALAVWNEYSDGKGNAPERNFWPDEFPIDMIEAWANDIQVIFGSDVPVTYSAMEAVYGAAPELWHTPAGEGVDYSYPFDTWTADYTVEGFTLYVTFVASADGADYEMYDLMISKA